MRAARMASSVALVKKSDARSKSSSDRVSMEVATLIA